MKPTSIILDLLRTYGARGTSVQDIANTGALFGFNDNRIRVNLSRLRAKGVIESCSRGHYRLCNTTDPVNAFAERWRLGEQRVIPWQGKWTCVHLPDSDKKTGKSQWALANFGFTAMDPGLWIRPDNLSQSNKELKQQLHVLGVHRDGIFITAAELEPVFEQAWLRTFQPTKLSRQYLEMTKLLEESLTKLRTLPEPMAKKESFDLGGRGIQMLAKDPLLPEQMQHPATREKLWQTMCRYDEAGRQVWAGQYKPDVTPTSQSEFTNTEVAL